MRLAFTAIVFASVISVGRTRADDLPSNSQALTLYHVDCSEILDPIAPAHHVQPWFHPENPLTMNVRLTFMRHKFGSAFTFSSDGKYVAIHHDIFPDAEQITLRDLDTGEKLSSLLWRGKGERLFNLRSADFDGESKRIVGLADNSFTDSTDAVMSWDGNQGNLIEQIELQTPQDKDYVPVSAYGNNHSFRSEISLAQPFYVRTQLRSKGRGTSEEPKEYSAQIVDWQSKQLLNLPTAAVDYLSIVDEPLNSRFRYAAVLQSDRTTVQLMSFDEISRQMTTSSKPFSGLLRGIQKVIVGLTEGRSSHDANLAIAGATADQSPTTFPEFSAPLIHDKPVKRVKLSNWAPFAVTQASEGLHVWNAKTGNEIGTIASSVQQFRVLEKMGLLAYSDGRGNLTLYSLFQARQIANFKGFSYYYLNSHLESRTQGLAYVTLDDGSIIQVTETLAEETGRPLYDVFNTRVHLKIPLNKSYRTLVQTAKGKYLVQIYEDRKSETALIVDVFSLDGHGQKITSRSFPVRAFQSQFELDPTGRNVLYTSDETLTGMLHLERLLDDAGL